MLPVFLNRADPFGLFRGDDLDRTEDLSGLHLGQGDGEHTETEAIFQSDRLIRLRLACRLRHGLGERVELLRLVAPVCERDDGEFFFLHRSRSLDERDEDCLQFLFHCCVVLFGFGFVLARRRCLTSTH